jgi:hypothetical protein
VVQNAKPVAGVLGNVLGVRHEFLISATDGWIARCDAQDAAQRIRPLLAVRVVEGRAFVDGASADWTPASLLVDQARDVSRTRAIAAPTCTAGVGEL